MSDPAAPSAPAKPPSAPPPVPPSAGRARASSESPRPPRPPSRGGPLAPLALLLALLALAGVALGGWQWWQWRAERQAGAKALAGATQHVHALAADVTALQRERADDAKARDALRENNQALDQRVDGQSTRVDNLEAAVASLARHGQQGRRAMLLDQAEFALRMGQARYALFHDAAGALKAYALAGESLAAVDDPALADVRRTLDAERKALAATHPATRAADLATLASLRSHIAQLPLRPLDAGTEGPASDGFWQRVWHALSTAVVVRRTDGAPQNLADARLTRQLAALDVAQAEAARAAWDTAAFHAALQRVDSALASAFDARAPGVRKARAQVARMLAEPATPSAAGEVGNTLEQLRNLRAVQGLRDAPPAPAASAPAPATSAAEPSA